MKKSLLLLASITFSLMLFAQTVVDPNNTNNGTINPGLTFGNQSGEGIGSKRTSGSNQFGLDFYTSFVNRMVISNTGRVGIGTNIPQQNLSVALGMNIDQNNANKGTVNPGLTFGWDSGEGIASNRLPGINQFGLDFYTAGNNRLCITSAGNVGIGILSPTVKLQVAGAIMSSGSVMPSDVRYKKNILPITSALKTVMSLSGFTYIYKKEEFPEMGFDSRPQYGLLAQNVETVVPELVYTDQNGYKGLDYTRLIPFLIEGMKEQQQSIEKQRQQIDELRKMVEKLSGL